MKCTKVFAIVLTFSIACVESEKVAREVIDLAGQIHTPKSKSFENNRGETQTEMDVRAIKREIDSQSPTDKKTMTDESKLILTSKNSAPDEPVVLHPHGYVETERSKGQGKKRGTADLAVAKRKLRNEPYRREIVRRRLNQLKQAKSTRDVDGKRFRSQDLFVDEEEDEKNKENSKPYPAKIFSQPVVALLSKTENSTETVPPADETVPEGEIPIPTPEVEIPISIPEGEIPITTPKDIIGIPVSPKHVTDILVPQVPATKQIMRIESVTINPTVPETDQTEHVTTEPFETTTETVSETISILRQSKTFGSLTFLPFEAPIKTPRTGVADWFSWPPSWWPFTAGTETQDPTTPESTTTALATEVAGPTAPAPAPMILPVQFVPVDADKTVNPGSPPKHTTALSQPSTTTTAPTTPAPIIIPVQFVPVLTENEPGNVSPGSPKPSTDPSVTTSASLPEPAVTTTLVPKPVIIPVQFVSVKAETPDDTNSSPGAPPPEASFPTPSSVTAVSGKAVQPTAGPVIIPVQFVPTDPQQATDKDLLSPTSTTASAPPTARPSNPIHSSGPIAPPPFPKVDQILIPIGFEPADPVSEASARSEKVEPGPPPSTTESSFPPQRLRFVPARKPIIPDSTVIKAQGPIGTPPRFRYLQIPSPKQIGTPVAINSNPSGSEIIFDIDIPNPNPVGENEMPVQPIRQVGLSLQPPIPKQPPIPAHVTPLHQTHGTLRVEPEREREQDVSYAPFPPNLSFQTLKNGARLLSNGVVIPHGYKCPYGK